ncbi:GtrA family protein [Ureibacillus chungkukjangi]|uniref:Putative flippase GtrA n=1 Tax=Ureibacillus chungkukjangi TaxID=1202712 RepID=A0A318TSA7_9BACL|nr:GtrA family protein [Ureibacillus chungkukjangi]MCM3388591.1 GtrA family protein [Ureibacillus chungkukjangi]PYF05908.1 putative flippase GtrA [Ureibacillus chungkukjangi]
MILSKTLFTKFLKYSFVGCICTLIYFISVFIFIEGLYMDPVVSSALSFIIMTIVSFFLNVKYTFGSIITRQRALRFTTVSAIGFLLNFLLMFVIVHLFNLHYVIGELVTILVIPVVNFILNNYWTFQSQT